MKKLYCLLFGILCTINLNAQTQFDWVKSPVDQSLCYSHDVAIDNAGNVYVIGDFASSTLQLGTTVLAMQANTEESFLVKYDSSGTLIWAQQFSHTSYMYLNQVSVDANGNVLVAGNFSESLSVGNYTFTNPSSSSDSLLLAKFTPDGNVIWATSSVAGTVVNAFDLITDNDNNIYVTGIFYDSLIVNDNITLTSPNGGSHFIVKYKSTGSVEWAKRGSITEVQTPLDRSRLTIDNLGNLLMTGAFRSGITFDNTSITGSPTLSVFLAKFNQQGQVQYLKNAGSSTNGCHPGGLKATADGSVYMANNFHGTLTIGNESFTGVRDIFVSKLDSNGNMLWGKTFGGTGRDNVAGLEVIGTDLYVAARTLSSSFTFGSATIINPFSDFERYNSFVATYKTDGTPVTATAAVNAGSIYANSMSENNGKIAIAGFYTGTFTLSDLTVSPSTTLTAAKFFVASGTTSLSVGDFNRQKLTVYPNPVKDKINIKADGFQDSKYSITNLLGQQIKMGTTQNHSIDVASLPNGVYILTINNSNLKFIKG